MDTKPFLEFNLLDIQESLVDELKRFTKSAFDLNVIRMAAGDLKYSKEIKQILVAQLKAPTEEFVQFFLSSVYSGVRTQEVVQQFTGIVKRTLNQFLSDQIDQRLQSIVSNGKTSEDSVEVEEPDASTVDKVETYSEHQTDEIHNALSTIAERFRARTTLEERETIGRMVAALRINAEGSKGMAWWKIREELRRTDGLHLKQEDLREVIRHEDHFKESVVERIESFEGGWEYQGDLTVLCGFEPIGEWLDRIEACKPRRNNKGRRFL